MNDEAAMDHRSRVDALHSRFKSIEYDELEMRNRIVCIERSRTEITKKDLEPPQIDHDLGH